MAAPGIGGRLVALPLAWLAGVALQLHERELWPLAAYVAIASAAAVAVLAGALARRAFPLVVAAALAGGFAVSGWQASLRLAETLPAELEGRDIVVTGVVASLPQQGPSGLRFRFDGRRGRRARRRADAARARLVRRLPRRRGARPAAPGAARRPALALHRAPAPAARQPQPARLRLRARPARAGRSRHRLRARRAGDAARRQRRLSGRAAAPARARCDLRTSPTAAPPACWPRSRSATRARSSATTGTCSATPASPT